MQRDYWYSSARNCNDLDAPPHVGRIAGERTVRRLNGRKLNTRTVPVLFEAPIATGLIGNFVGAVSGGSLYRKSSFLLDSLGKEVFAPLIQIPRNAPPEKASAAAPSTAKASPPEARHRQGRRAARLFPLQLLGAQARHDHHRQRRRQPQPHRHRPATTTSPAC